MFAVPRFSDIQTHWARSFIESLTQRGIVKGFPDQTFRPDRSVTRAECAALLQAAFTRPAKRAYVPFRDVPASFWAANAIRKAYETGFLSGYPEQVFRPNDNITRVQAIVALVSGLELQSSGAAPLADLYQDAKEIPSYGVSAIATATELGMIVNYPNLKRLQPAQAATRAEVAAFIYQALVTVGQAPPIESGAIVRWLRTVAVRHTREFRAAWVTSVWNRDWVSQPGLPNDRQQAELLTILDRLQALNFNALILQVRPEGDALYPSTIEPWSHWLTGKQGKAPEPLYDPLAFAIDQCHQRNIELHAWFNPYRARTSRDTVNARSHVAITNPSVVYEWGNQLWMDPGSPAIQDQTYRVILDVVRRYDVDGIHLDDYFYPYPLAGQDFPDAATYQRYRSQGGTLSLADWRRDNVNQLVQRLATGIRTEKSHVKFGISPFGIYRPGQPAQIQGLDAYDRLYADALKWLQQGWVDYLAPQLYWRIDPPAQSYPVLLNWWTDNNPQQRHIYVGNNLSQLDGKAWELSEIERQIDLTRQQRSRLALGNIFFSMDDLLTNREGVRDRFQTATFRSPALVPQMPWLSAALPSIPANLRVAEGKLTWTPAANVRAWTLYRQQSDTWNLTRILPASTTSAIVSPGTYALCRVDRLAAESAGVVVTV